MAQTIVIWTIFLVVGPMLVAWIATRLGLHHGTVQSFGVGVILGSPAVFAATVFSALLWNYGVRPPRKTTWSLDSASRSSSIETAFAVGFR